MAELGGGLALQELHVVDQQQVDPAQPFLEAQRRLALHRSDEMVHEVVGRQVDDVAAGLGGTGRPGDGIEQVRLAQPDARMDVDRVEAHRVVGGSMGHLLGHLQRHLVGRAGDEGVEGHLGVERAARQRIATRRLRHRLAHQAGRSGHSALLGVLDLGFLVGLRQAWPGLAVDPHREVQPVQGAEFGLEGLEDLFGIVRLHPGAEEPGRHRQMGEVIDDLFQLEPGKPGAIDVFADGSPQARPDTLEHLA